MSVTENGVAERGTAGLIVRGAGLGVLGLVEGLLLVWVGLVWCLAVIGIGLPLLPGALDTVRAEARLQRRLALSWSGVRVRENYAPEGDAPATRLRRVHRMIGDGATWRDLLWLVVNPVVGPVLGLVPALALLDGLFGLTLPFDWHTVTAHFDHTWFAFVPVNGEMSAILAAVVGLAEIALAVTVLPRAMVSLHGRWVRTVLGATARPGRSETLTATSADLLTAVAGELG